MMLLMSTHNIIMLEKIEKKYPKKIIIKYSS